MTNEYCKGCFVHMPDEDPHDLSCILVTYNDRGQCPCTNCIVKVMCKESCEYYGDFSKSANEKGKR